MSDSRARDDQALACILPMHFMFVNVMYVAYDMT